MMSFNPHRAGGTPTGPSVSGGNISQLLNMSQNSGDKAIEALVNFGKLKRSGNVNDLIARGELQGLNEQQSQAKLLEAAGGSINKDTQKTIDLLLGRKATEAAVEADKDKVLQQQGFDMNKLNVKNENDVNLQNLADSNALTRLGIKNSHDLNKLNVEQKNALSILLREQKFKANQDLVNNNAAMSRIIANNKAKTSENVNKILPTEKPFIEAGQKGMISAGEKYAPVVKNLFTKSIAGDPSKHFGLDFALGALDVDIDDLSETDSRILDDVINESMLSKKHQIGSTLSPNIVVSDIKDRLGSRGLKLDTEFKFSNLLPFGDNPRVQKIRKMTNAEKKEYNLLRSNLR